MQGQKELGSQSNYSFPDRTNLCLNQTFSNNYELQLLLAEAEAKKSLDFVTVKSCTKYLNGKYVYHKCAWMLRARKYEFQIDFVSTSTLRNIVMALNMQTVATEKFQSK